MASFPQDIMQPVPAPVAMAFWPGYRSLIAAALETSPGVETIEDVEQRLATGAYQAFFGRRSIAITEISHFDQATAVTVIHGGGELAELLDTLEPLIHDYACAIGADLLMGQGRLGWKRPCEAKGYRFGWIVMVKDIRQSGEAAPPAPNFVTL